MSGHDENPRAEGGSDRDLYDAWRAERGAAKAPAGFPERVLAALPAGAPAARADATADATAERDRGASQEAGSSQARASGEAPVEQLPWLARPALRAAAILLALALGLLRLSSVLSLLTV
jgi:hypothetical protein